MPCAGRTTPSSCAFARGAERRWGAPYLALHRADLQQALARVAERRDKIRLALGSTVESVAIDDGRVGVDVTRGAATIRETRPISWSARTGCVPAYAKRSPPAARTPPAFTGRVAFRGPFPPSASIPAGGRRASSCASDPTPISCTIRCATVHPQCRRCDRRIPGGNRTSIPGTASPTGPALDRAFARWSASTRELLAGRRIGAPGRFTDVQRSAPSRSAALRWSETPRIRWSRSSLRARLRRSRTRARSGRRSRSRRRAPGALGLFGCPRFARDPRSGRGVAARPDLSPKGAMALARDAAMRLAGARRLSARYDWLYGA